MCEQTLKVYNYRPQRSCKSYVSTGVCLSTGEGGAWSRGGLVLGVGSGPGGGVCSWGGTWSQGGAIPGGLVSQYALRQTPLGEIATAADGTHPTGMHSCSVLFLNLRQQNV